MATCLCGCGGLPNPGYEWLRGHGVRQLRRQGLSEADYAVDAKGCWVWALGRDSDGYGRVKLNGKSRYAHRAMYEQVVGPPHGAALDHLCRNRACVNPEHLEPVTRQENAQRSPLFVTLTPEAVRAIRVAREPLAVIAERFGISRTHVSRIRSGRCWSNITP